MTVVVERAGPAVSVQDGGRPGAIGMGLSRGGAADRQAWLAGVALLGQEPGAAAVEMAGLGGTFRFQRDTRIALTGAPMRAMLDRAPVAWNATHRVSAGSVLEIGAVERGVYGYLALGGGIETPLDLGGRGYHRIAGLGRPLAAGDMLPLAADPAPASAAMRLEMPSVTGPVRVMPGPQTMLFPDETRAEFEAAGFRRSPRANRQGVRLDHTGAPFATAGQLQQVSDFITEGDIQMTGDGTPYVLMAECQTMGGYPRIGTVLPSDLPRIAQAEPGETLRFRFVTTDEAEAAWESDETILARLKRRRTPLVRDPREIGDLLNYELIDRPPDDIVD